MNCPVCNAVIFPCVILLKEGFCQKDLICGICKSIFRLEFKILKESSLTKEQITLKMNKSTYSTYDDQQHVIEYPVKKGK